MASKDDIKQAIGCLSTVFPQFIAKELAGLTDQVATAIQSFTDPLSAIGDLKVDSLVDDVASLSEGDIYSNLGGVAVGLMGQYAQREATDMMAVIASEYPSVTKRVQAIRNLGSAVATAAGSMMALFPDMPYAAAQRMCKTIIDATNLKEQNLRCLRKHIVQLVNAILVMAKSVDNYTDETFADLDQVASRLVQVQQALVESQRLKDGTVTFDSQAFERARQGLLAVSSLLTPDKDGTSIADLVDMAEYGSVKTAEVTKANRRLTLLVVPSLINLIEVEIGAIVQQITVINFYIGQLGQVIASYRKVGMTSRIQEQRSRAIAEIRRRLTDLAERVDVARVQRSLRAASGEMLFWASRVKTILATMDDVKQLTLQEGSIEGPDKAFELEQAFQGLLTGLTAIHDDVTVAGIEDPLPLRDKVLALTAAARRVMKDLETGRTNADRLETLHGLALQTATAQVSRTERSITVAQEQRALCQKFASIDLQFKSKFDKTLDSLRQLGLDRGVDLLSSGMFENFLEADLDGLSYLGIAIQCLSHGLSGIDDAQTRLQVSGIRDNLIAERTSQDIAAADSADQGRKRLVVNLKTQMATIQKNAKTIESIVDDLKQIYTAAGESVSEAISSVSAINPFNINLDHLAVGAGGRLAADLEEFSEHPNAGVVLCD